VYRPRPSQSILLTGQREPSPPVGVAIVCSTCETNNVHRVIATLKAAGLEVIVVTPSRAIANQAANNAIVVFEGRRRGKAAAINLGLIKARELGTDIIVFADADVLFDESSVNALVEEVRNGAGLACSTIQVLNGQDGLMGRIGRAIWVLHNETLLFLSRAGRLAHASGFLCAVRASLLRLLPSWVINDDSFIAQLIAHEGAKVVCTPNSRVFVLSALSPADYVMQRSRIIQGHAEMARRGLRPTVFETLALSRPRTALMIAARALRRQGPAWALSLVIAGLLELLSLIYSFVKRALKRDDRIWRRINSLS
jgi:cellulose synthase/poly-beta-1,6-N-acetylglucosamine synthase-like glycosyltransferase